MTKRLKLASVIFAVVILASCSKSSSNIEYEKNDYLGAFPSVYIEKSKALQELKEVYIEKMSSDLDEKKALKIYSEWERKEKEMNENFLKDATTAFEEIFNNEIPFEIQYNHPDFLVKVARVSEALPETGALHVNLIIEAKRDVKPNYYANLTYVIANLDGTATKGQINPFVKTQIFSPTSFYQKFDSLNTIKAGEICCAEGSDLMIYCGSYDFTQFFKILFVER